MSDDVVFHYTYDAAGRKTSVSTKIGTTGSYTVDYINEYDYDALGRIVKVTQAGVTGGTTVAEKRVDFAYSDDGTFARIDRYADLAGTKHVAATDQAFDHLGRVSDITHRRADEVFADYDYTWDEASRITAIDMDFSAGATGTEYDDTATYNYDNTSQLTGADYDDTKAVQDDETYQYDDTGNRTMTGYVTGDANRMLSDAAGYQPVEKPPWQSRIFVDNVSGFHVLNTRVRELAWRVGGEGRGSGSFGYRPAKWLVRRGTSSTTR